MLGKYDFTDFPIFPYYPLKGLPITPFRAPPNVMAARISLVNELEVRSRLEHKRQDVTEHVTGVLDFVPQAAMRG